MTPEIRDLKGLILGEIAHRGPVLASIDEEGYQWLRRQMRSIWEKPGHVDRDKKWLVLAFLRGYTFHREVSEDENKFWSNFHKELGIHRGELPTAKQYDLLESALRSYEGIELQVRGGKARRRREFVKTIDSVWGIGKFSVGEVLDLFLDYYKRFSSERPTAVPSEEVFKRLRPNEGAQFWRQAAAYGPILAALASLIPSLLKAPLNLDLNDPAKVDSWLQQQGLEVGTPNPIHFLANKGPSSLAKLLRLPGRPEPLNQHQTIARRRSGVAPATRSAGGFSGQLRVPDATSDDQVEPILVTVVDSCNIEKEELTFQRHNDLDPIVLGRAEILDFFLGDEEPQAIRWIPERSPTHQRLEFFEDKWVELSIEAKELTWGHLVDAAKGKALGILELPASSDPYLEGNFPFPKYQLRASLQSHQDDKVSVLPGPGGLGDLLRQIEKKAEAYDELLIELSPQEASRPARASHPWFILLHIPVRQKPQFSAELQGTDLVLRLPTYDNFSVQLELRAPEKVSEFKELQAKRQAELRHPLSTYQLLLGGQVRLVLNWQGEQVGDPIELKIPKISWTSLLEQGVGLGDLSGI